MNGHYFEVMHAIQSAEWQGYNVHHTNGRFTATPKDDTVHRVSGTFYLNTDNNGFSYYWQGI